MEVYENIYDSLTNQETLYYDIILSFDDGGKIYTSKYFLSYISPFFEKLLKYDKHEDNTYHLPHKKTKTVQMIIALSFPFIDLNKILNEIKINPEIMFLIDEWCMSKLWKMIESFFHRQYANYKLEEIFYFANKCKFEKVTEKIISEMTIKKYNTIKESTTWDKLDDSIKIKLSESVMENIKKRKFNYYD